MLVQLLGTGRAGDVVPRPGCACPPCRHTPVPPRPAAALVNGRLLLDDGPWQGEPRDLAGLTVVALAAGDATGQPWPGQEVLLVRDDAGAALLWAPTTGPLPDATLAALADVQVDVAVLGLPLPGAQAGPGLTALGHQVARLRARRVLTGGTQVAAVALGHVAPAPDRLAELLAPWGVRACADGDLLTVPAGGVPGRGVHRTLVTGGAASGKSAWAEHLLAAEPAVLYVATGPAPGPDDADWAARVQVHRDRRPSWWTTLHCPGTPGALAAQLGGANAPVLWDSVGTWLTAVLDETGAWEDAPGWRSAVETEVASVVRAWCQIRVPSVAVAEEVGSGVVPATASGRLFRDLAGDLTRRLAEVSDTVTLVVAGRRTDLS